MRTTRVLGSADLWTAMQTNILPRTFSVGDPQVVVSSTPGSVRPIARTRSNPVRRGAFAVGRRVISDWFQSRSVPRHGIAVYFVDDGVDQKAMCNRHRDVSRTRDYIRPG